jgi:hypothetical protein
MEYLKGAPLSLSGDNAVIAGHALGEMSRVFGNVFRNEYPFDKGRLRDLSLEMPAARFMDSLESDDLRNKVGSVLNLYNDSLPSIRSWKERYESCFCHNDIKAQNVFFEKISAPHICVIDWAGAGWESMGSDIGGLWFSSGYHGFEKKGLSESIESDLYTGFLRGIGKESTPDLADNLYISANLHFALRFYRWALQSKNHLLLKRSINRLSLVCSRFS